MYKVHITTPRYYHDPFRAAFKGTALKGTFSTLALKVNFPAELSSNHNQTHFSQSAATCHQLLYVREQDGHFAR